MSYYEFASHILIPLSIVKQLVFSRATNSVAALNLNVLRLHRQGRAASLSRPAHPSAPVIQPVATEVPRATGRASKQPAPTALLPDQKTSGAAANNMRSPRVAQLVNDIFTQRL